MKKIILSVLFLLSLTSLAHAEGDLYTGTLTGTILDVRTAPAPTPGQYPPDDEYNYGRAQEMGPFFVLVEDGTNHVHPLYEYSSPFLGTETSPQDPNVEYLAPYANKHVRLSGEISTGSNWPSVAKITNIENA